MSDEGVQDDEGDGLLQQRQRRDNRIVTIMRVEGRGGGKGEANAKGMTRVMGGHDNNNNIDIDDVTSGCHHSHLAGRGKSAGADWAMVG